MSSAECGVHCVVDFNGGRNRLFSDEVYNRLPGRTKFTANYMPRFYGSGTFTSNGGTVGYDGRVGFIEIGGP